MLLRKLSLATVLTLSLSACATKEIIVPPAPLPIPSAPVYPTINAVDLQCLTDEAYTKLVERDSLRKAYIDELISIIKSTHEE